MGDVDQVPHHVGYLSCAADWSPLKQVRECPLNETDGETLATEGIPFDRLDIAAEVWQCF